MSKFYFIQYLRGIAILLVFLYHSHVQFVKYSVDNIYLDFFKYSGFIGVILFFTISGFIMSYILYSEEKSFYLKRFLRIYPSFIIAVMTILFLKVLFFGAVKEMHLIYALTLLPLNVMVHPSSVSLPSYPLGIEWTLIFEIFFYFIVGLFNNKYFRKFFIYSMLLWLIIIIFVYLNLNTPLNTRITYKEIIISLYNVPFIFGSFVYFIYSKLKNRTLKLNIAIFCTVVILFVVIANSVIYFGINYFNRILIVSLFSSILLLLSLYIDEPKNIRNSIMIKIGDSSYGIYLIHLGLLSILFSLFHNYLNFGIGMMIILIVFFLSYGYGIMDIKFYKISKSTLRINNE